MYPCKYCNNQIYPLNRHFSIKNLEGKTVFVNGNLYCSKQCFVMKNVFSHRFEVFDYDDIKKERSSVFISDKTTKYNLNEKNELNSKNK